MILDLVRIADRRSARTFAVEHPRAFVLGVGDEDPRVWPGNGRREWIPLVDGERIAPPEFWRAAALLNEMEGLRAAPVIVTCHAGESRSAAVVVGWMLRHRPFMVRDLMSHTGPIETLPELFRVTNGWLDDEAKQERQGVPTSLTQHPLFPALATCYKRLAPAYPRIICGPGMWTTLLRATSIRQALGLTP